jgi:hypothetical protein
MLLGLLPTDFGLALVRIHYLTAREDKPTDVAGDIDPVV